MQPPNCTTECSEVGCRWPEVHSLGGFCPTWRLTHGRRGRQRDPGYHCPCVQCSTEIPKLLPASASSLNARVKGRVTQQHHKRMDVSFSPFQRKKKMHHDLIASLMLTLPVGKKRRCTMNPRLLFHKTPVHSSSYALLAKGNAISFIIKQHREE